MKSHQNRTEGDDLAVLLVEDEESLLGLLERSLDADGERVEADERTVGDEVATVEALVVVTRTRQVGLTGLVPLCDGLVHRNRQSTDTTVVLHGVPVVEANHLAVDHDVGVVRRRDDDLDPLVPRVPRREGVVHEEFERVAEFRSRTNLVGDSAVIPDARRDDEVEVALLQQEVDTRLEELKCPTRGFDRAQRTRLQVLLVDGTSDEVPTEPQHEVVDGGVHALDFHQTKGDLEEGFRTTLGDAEVEGIEAVDRVAYHGFLDVPVACENEGCGLRDFAVEGLNLEGIRSDDVLRRQLAFEGLVFLDKVLDGGLVFGASYAFLMLLHGVAHEASPFLLSCMIWKEHIWARPS